MFKVMEGEKSPPAVQAVLELHHLFSSPCRQRWVCASAEPRRVGVQGSSPQDPGGLWSWDGAWRIGGVRDVGTEAPSHSHLASDA